MLQSDAYMFLTECHRLYVRGVRRALRDRLMKEFGEEWWERGVVPAVMRNTAII